MNYASSTTTHTLSLHDALPILIIVSSGVVPCSRDEMEVSMPAMISAKVMIDTARQPERGSAARRRAPTSSDGLGLSAATALATAQTMNGPATFTQIGRASCRERV